MNKIIRTNEHCRICDFHRPIKESTFRDYTTFDGLSRTSIYNDSLTDGSFDEQTLEGSKSYHRYQDARGRYVFIDQRDGTPICTSCAKEVSIIRQDWYEKDKAEKEYQELVEEWERRLGDEFKNSSDEHLVQDAEIKEPMEPEIT